MSEPQTHTEMHDQVARYLRKQHLRLVTAESCTAGLIAARLASVPGAGEVLDCAFVVYDPRAKMRCLDVPAELLATFNLTSEPVALAMAQGALQHCDATVAVANTGVADDSDPQIPSGTQCYAWVFRTGEQTHSFTATQRFTGDRNAIREASADHALRCLPHYHELFLRSCNPDGSQAGSPTQLSAPRAMTPLRNP